MISKACESLLKKTFEPNEAMSFLKQLSSLSPLQIEDVQICRAPGVSFNPRVCRHIDIAIKQFGSNKKLLEQLIGLSLKTNDEIAHNHPPSEALAVVMLDSIRHAHMGATQGSALLYLGKLKESVATLSSDTVAFFQSNADRYTQKLEAHDSVS